MAVPHPRSGDHIGQQAELGGERHVLAVADIVESAGRQEGVAPDGTEVRPTIGHPVGEVVTPCGAPIERPAVCPGILGVGDGDVPRVGAGARSRQNRPTQPLETVRLKNEVGVDERDDLARGKRHPHVLRRRGSSMAHRHNPDPAVLCQGGGPVRRAIVDDQDFEVVETLRQQGIEAVADRGLLVVGGHDRRDLGRPTRATGATRRAAPGLGIAAGASRPDNACRKARRRTVMAAMTSGEDMRNRTRIDRRWRAIADPALAHWTSGVQGPPRTEGA